MSKPPKIKPENEVNAYLFYSQRLLHLLKTPAFIEHKADAMALTSAVCLTLKQAWQAWLKELSAYVGGDIVDINSLILAEFNHHPELQLLIDIKKQPANWLSQLILYFEPRLNTPTVLDEEKDDQKAFRADSIINIVQINAEELSEIDQLSKVISEFKTYIQSVRSRQAEW